MAAVDHTRRRGLAFALPALLIVAAVLVGPALWALLLGLTDYRVHAGAPKVVGVGNYTGAVRDREFRAALGRTFLYVVGSAVIGQTLLGFALAWSLRSARRRVRILVETLALLAWILPGVVVAWLWIAFLKDHGGTLDAILGTPGRDWWAEHPLGSLIIFNVWRGAGFSMVMFTAALSSVPASRWEAARLAGASSWQQLRDVVILGIRRHILANVLLVGLWTLNDFTPYLLTGGRTSPVLPVYIYQAALPGGRLGFASAVSLALLVINLLLALAYVRMTRRRA
jgi:multiple sugar transport system permease protein